MQKPQRWLAHGGVFILAFAGMLIGQTGDTVVPADGSSDTYQLTVSHPECTFFGPRRERFVRESLQARGAKNADIYALSSTTDKVSQMLGFVPRGRRTYTLD